MLKLLRRLFKKPKLNAVAGILNDRNAVRVVCGPLENMHCHIFPGDRLFVLPIQVPDPVPWNDIPNLIETVEKYVERNK